MNKNRYEYFVLIVVLLLAVPIYGLAQDGQKQGGNKTETETPAKAHILATPAEIAWGRPDPSGNSSMQSVVLDGDPMKSGAPFTLRLKMPDGFVVLPHWHPVDENVVVVQGTLMMGAGEKFDRNNAHELPVGSYALMPKDTRHFFWATGETIIHVYGIGPFRTSWVKP